MYVYLCMYAYVCMCMHMYTYVCIICDIDLPRGKRSLNMNK